MSVVVTIKKNDTLPNAIALLLSDSKYIETSRVAQGKARAKAPHKEPPTDVAAVRWLGALWQSADISC